MGTLTTIFAASLVAAMFWNTSTGIFLRKTLSVGLFLCFIVWMVC